MCVRRAAIARIDSAGGLGVPAETRRAKGLLVVAPFCFLSFLAAGAANFALIFFTLLPDPANWPGSLTHVGEPVPEFSVTTLDGEQVSSSELRGKVVLLGFFATWCGPCRHELPHLQKIWEDLGDRHDFAMIVVGRGETKDKLVDFQSKQKLTLPLAPDPQQLVYGKFATKAIPRTYPISRDGTIIYQCTGYEEEYVADLRRAVEAELSKP